MGDFSQEELAEALCAINSTISKCEKALPKLREGSSQHTLTIRRIKAFKIAVDLLNREIDVMNAEKKASDLN